jgi:hypothetical protein
MGSHPADQIIEGLGGRALVDGIIDFDNDRWRSTSHGEVYLHLTCVAPDEETAAAIVAEVEHYLQRDKKATPGAMFETPWRAFTVGWGLASFSGSVRRDGRTLTFEDGNFFHIADGFPGLLAYLRDKGCTEIDYAFSEDRQKFEHEF